MNQMQKPKILERAPRAPQAVSGEIRASLPGQVTQMNATVGQNVRKGERLAILEAMKMENEILSPKDGVVKQIAAPQGTTVMKGDLIVEIG
jgi:biotin carboxyl carrier protein